MTKIRTHNKRKKVAHDTKVQLAAIDHHDQRCERLAKSGTLHKLKNSDWIRRVEARARKNLREQRKAEMERLNWAEAE